MVQRYSQGDTGACITLEVDNTFQPIRIEYCGHVTKTNNMASCCRRVAELRTPIFKSDLEQGLDVERYDKSKTNLVGNVLGRDQHCVGPRPSCAPSGPALGSGPTLVLIPDLLLPSRLVSSIYQ